MARLLVLLVLVIRVKALGTEALAACMVGVFSPGRSGAAAARSTLLAEAVAPALVLFFAVRLVLLVGAILLIAS